MNSKIISLAGISLILAIAACTLPSTQQPPLVDDQAATIIAATLTAMAGNESGGTPTATRQVMPTITTTAGSTPTGGATASITPTYSTPMLTVLQQTNCREGPGQDYQIIFTYLAGVKREIIGRYDPTNFWLVKSPESKTGTCWLWGEYTELSGSYWVVPTVTPPATATLPPPSAPSITQWDFSCSGGNVTFNLQWEDRATNETGYRIFRDGESIAELPANSTSWTQTSPLEDGESTEYYLQVYGPSGTANSSTMKLEC